MKHYFTVVFSLLFCTSINAQSRKTENLIVVVLDGMRWQEIFSGADSALLQNPSFTKNKSRLTRKYWDSNPKVRREKLLPFLWKTVGTKGQLYGNRHLENLVNVSNPYQLTYPGFSEMLTGFVDSAITSNRLVTSKSENVLEFINKQKGFEGKVAVFATSDLFPYLLDKNNSKLYINADTDSLAFEATEFRLLNDIQRLSNKPTTERPDLLTYFSAREYVRSFKPRVLYLALGETDAFAHEGNYDQYLETANAEDKMLEELWNLLQTIPQYKDKTSLVITCDHGRGDVVKAEWTSHGPQIKDSGQIWMGVVGPDVKAVGEVKLKGQLFQSQLAATISKLIGFEFKPQNHPASEPIRQILLK